MPITPTPPHYGLTSADISSITDAREGLVKGFEALGQQIREDIGRIAVTRQLQGFGQELGQLNPNSPTFPQQAVAVMARYPLAASTGAGREGIALLGQQHTNWQNAQNILQDIGGGNFYLKGVGLATKDEQGKLIPTAKSGSNPVGWTTLEDGWMDNPKVPYQQKLNPDTGEYEYRQKSQVGRVANRTAEGTPMYESPDGTKLYRDGTTITADGKIYRNVGGVTYDFSSGTPTPINDKTTQNILLRAHIGSAFRQADAARKALSQTRSDYNAVTDPLIKESIGKDLRQQQAEYDAAEKIISGLMSGQFPQQQSAPVQPQQPQGGLGALGVNAAPPVQPPALTPSPAPVDQSPPPPLPDQLPNIDQQSAPPPVPNGPRGKRWSFDPSTGRINLLQ